MQRSNDWEECGRKCYWSILRFVFAYRFWENYVIPAVRTNIWTRSPTKSKQRHTATYSVWHAMSCCMVMSDGG